MGELIRDMLAFKAKAGIEDYLTVTAKEDTPMVRELDKYSNIKKGGEDDFNENISITGNPYRKKRKTEGESSSKNRGTVNLGAGDSIKPIAVDGQFIKAAPIRELTHLTQKPVH